MFGARLAAMLGVPYGFASHFAPTHLVDAVALYRSEFSPSAQLAEPYVIAGVNVIAAETEEEAEIQYRDVARRRVARFLRSPRALTADEADQILASPQGQHIAQMMHYTASGTGDYVHRYLEHLATEANVDELITVHPSPTIDERLRSIDLLADAHDPTGQSATAS
jgi:alkanesulfonate monooxygenase SsuD/methylene tetrahydromethanopterin reductase-like flavin-dependent oxidoreductase (luciferase family)